MDKIDTKPLGRPREFDEEQALQLAAQAFLQDGFEAASYQKIAEAMRLSKPSLYNAFGNKAQLFERVIREYSMQAQTAILESFSKGATFQQGAEHLFRETANFYSRPDGPSIGCLLIGTALPASAQYDGIRSILANFITSLEAGLEQIMLTQYAPDLKKIGRSPGDMAALISSLIFTLAIHARTGLSRPALIKAAAKTAALLV